MADNTTELEVLNQIVDVLGGQSGQHETVVPVLEDIRDLLGGGGGGGGYNPALSVGRADALTGADTTAQWVQQVSTGNGAATVRSVQGAAVAWNQICNWFRATQTVSGVTFTNNGDGSVTLSGTATADAYLTAEPQVISSHKYMFRGCPQGGSASTYYGYITMRGFQPTVLDTGGGNFGVANQDGDARQIIYVKSGTTCDNVTFWPQLFDLTAIFGSGNEPTAVAEFERMYPEAYYPYSAPTLKPVQIAGIASTDAQGGELDAIEWPTQTLRAAGSVRDALYSDHVDVKVGAVDLGTLTWTYRAASAVFYANVGDSMWPFDNSANAVSLECAKYEMTTPTGVTNTSIPDKSFTRRSNAGSTEIIVSDSTYTTAADFTAAVSGAYLFFVLATPTTTPISPALNMTYRVQAGGSESIIVPDGEVSAVPVLTIAEGESAADVVMDALACIATPDGPTATANHALGTYLTMGGKLYKVTSAIAVGETIKSGTNVSQTTVMAELIARTA